LSVAFPQPTGANHTQQQKHLLRQLINHECHPMFNLLLLLNFASLIAFGVGLINPEFVLRGENRTRRKSSEIYLSVFVLSFVGMIIFVPKPQPAVVIAPATKSKAKVAVAPTQEVTPSPTPTATPTPTEPVEIKPPKEETNTTTHSDGSYTKDTIETRTFQNPDKSTGV
jgi:hypothetical protein